MVSNALNNLKAVILAALYESISLYVRGNLPLIQDEQVFSYWRKNRHLKLVNCPRRASTVKLGFTVEDPSAPGNLLATDRSKAVVLV